MICYKSEQVWPHETDIIPIHHTPPNIKKHSQGSYFSLITMRSISFAAITITLFQCVLAQKGFHLMVRHASWIHKTASDACPKRVDCAEIREPFDDDGVWLVPANQFTCNVIRDRVRKCRSRNL
jgi:hypothetical protein